MLFIVLSVVSLVVVRVHVATASADKQTCCANLRSGEWHCDDADSGSEVPVAAAAGSECARFSYPKDLPRRQYAEELRRHVQDGQLSRSISVLQTLSSNSDGCRAICPRMRNHMEGITLNASVPHRCRSDSSTVACHYLRQRAIARAIAASHTDFSRHEVQGEDNRKRIRFIHEFLRMQHELLPIGCLLFLLDQEALRGLDLNSMGRIVWPFADECQENPLGDTCQMRVHATMKNFENFLAALQSLTLQ